MKCLNCGQELVEMRAGAKFCSNKCKLAYRRDKLSVSKETENDTDNKISVSNDTDNQLSVSKLETDDTDNDTDNLDVKKMSKDELLMRINSYEHDTWSDGPEYLELKHRAESWDIKKLESEHYFVPCRRYPNPLIHHKG